MATTPTKTKQSKVSSKNNSFSLAVKNADSKSPVKKKILTKSKSKTPVVKAVKKTPVKKVPAKKAVKKSAKQKKAAGKTKAKKVSKETPSTTPLLSKEEVLRAVRREPLGHLLVEQLLNDAGFHGTISTDKELLEKYATDESIFSIQPQIVIQPKRQRDVEIAVEVLGDETKRFPSLSLTPRAAGTGLSGGSLTDSIIIDVSRYMHAIGDMIEQKEKITITCQPGAMWKDVEKQLKKHDAYLPPYPASKDICSIGGSVGNNAAGPDSLRYGHVADWVESIDITLYDGNTYTVTALTFKEYKALIKKKNALSTIAKQIFALIEKNESEIKKAKPKTKKNSAGYPLWDVIDTDTKSFKKGEGTFDLTRLISGSQGTVGVITSVTMRAQKIAHDTTLMTIPLFDITNAGNVIMEALKDEPINVELFDALTYDLAMKNPGFFKERISGFDYYKVLLSMYTTHHVRHGRKIPELTLLVTLNTETTDIQKQKEILTAIRKHCKKARFVTNPAEREMLWQIRRASYTLSKLKDRTKRPAAFLEDMTVPPKNIAKFFGEIKQLLRKYNITAAVHGHGGNGHFHFYPLLDFTNKTTPKLIEKMADEFFAVAVKYDGNICGEHNDGIIRTPHLSKMFTRKTLNLFKQVEHIFDPVDIFNPGKKVNPRFDIKSSIRKSN